MVKSRRARSSSSDTPYATTACRPSVATSRRKVVTSCSSPSPVEHADRAVLDPHLHRPGEELLHLLRRGRGGDVVVGMGMLEQGIAQVAAHAPGFEAGAFELARDLENRLGNFDGREAHLSYRTPRRPTGRSSAPSGPGRARGARPGSRPWPPGGRPHPRRRTAETPLPWGTGYASTTGFPSSIQRAIAGTAPGGMLPLPKATTTTPSCVGRARSSIPPSSPTTIGTSAIRADNPEGFSAAAPLPSRRSPRFPASPLSAVDHAPVLHPSRFAPHAVR